MKDKIIDNYINLENQGLEKNNGIILQNDQFKLIDDTNYSRAKKYEFNGHNYFTKRVYNGEILYMLQNIVASKMYQGVGIITPPSFPILAPNGELNTISQDTTTLEELLITLGSDTAPYKNNIITPKERQRYHDKWEILTNEKIKRHFLKHLTPECFESLINLFLIDELRTESDRHSDNYFFVKSADSEKYQEVIAIDHDLAAITMRDFNDMSFKDFLKEKYLTFNPSSTVDSANYEDRINNIINLIENGLLTENNINTLKSTLTYKFPEALKETCKKYNYEWCQNKLYEPFARLWEYLHNTIGKELNM